MNQNNFQSNREDQFLEGERGMVINNNPSDFMEKMQKCQEHIGALEGERRKVLVFERELPLCLELVTQAIERCRQQMYGTTRDYFNGQFDQCSGQTSSEDPVFEEFIPIKRTTSTNEDDHWQKHQHHQLSHKPKNICSQDKSSSRSMKSGWLSSAQLSIQTPGPPIKEDLSSKKQLVMEVSRNGRGAFHPLEKEKSSSAALTIGVERSLTCAAMVPTAATSSPVDTDGCGGGESKGEDKRVSNRKARRCWSPELHRRFLHALQQLGGAHVATPKQIRELMKIDGLTSDEVKSHLQKYRLHTRRLDPTVHNNHTQTPQFVVVSGLWTPPPEYIAMAASTPSSGDTNNTKGVYTPIASLPPSLYRTRQIKQQSHSDVKGSHSHSHLPSTCSSTHTTTASPAFGFS